MTSLCKINALSALLSVFIVSDPFLCVILEVLYIPDFIYNGWCGIWVMGSLHQSSALGNTSDQPHEQTRGWWHCFAQRLLQWRKSNLRPQQSLDQFFFQEDHVNILLFAAELAGIPWLLVQRALMGPSPLPCFSWPTRWDPTHNLCDHSRHQTLM